MRVEPLDVDVRKDDERVGNRGAPCAARECEGQHAREKTFHGDLTSTA
jgi:hypothetical protein